MAKKQAVRQGKITDYTPDPSNANKGTMRGSFMVEESLQKAGAGRSIVVDRNGVIIAGNKTQQGAVDSDITDVIEVETDGTQVVVVKRTDLDLLNGDERARLLAYYDNRASQVGLEWDLEQLQRDLDAGLDLGGLWFEGELERLLNPDTSPIDPNAEWQGMPGFEHDDLTGEAAFTVRVYLKDAEDLAAFGRMLGKDLTGKKFVWFSKQPISALHEVYDEPPK